MTPGIKFFWLILSIIWLGAEFQAGNFALGWAFVVVSGAVTAACLFHYLDKGFD